MRAPENFTGREFGKLTVLAKTDKRDRHLNFLWECQCACGKRVLTIAAKLRNGDAKSCGCLKDFNLTGRRFGRLVVLGSAGNYSYNWKTLLFNCRCDCGTEKAILGTLLRRGLTKSCGCLRHKSPPNRTHGMAGSRIYQTWLRMIRRCTEKSCRDFPDYGGRGIVVCARWMQFENFFADMGAAPPGKTLDRRNNDHGYQPDNCRWATAKEQANNTRKNHRITALGRTQTLSQWAEEANLRAATIAARIKCGWPTDKAVSAPLHLRRALNQQLDVQGSS
jgi:hypothetical protein